MPGVMTGEGIGKLGGGKFVGILQPDINRDGTPNYDSGLPGQ